MASTKDRILEVVGRLPKDSDGWVEYDLDPIANEIRDKAKNNIQVQVSELIQKGQLEAQREGRFIKRVRLAQAHSLEQIKLGSGSQTERMLHYLFGLADEKGVIRGDALDIRHLQQTLGFRDFHDTNKALHNLNKLGILEIRETRTGNGEKHRITKMRLRIEHQKSWLIDLLSDEELPGNTDIEIEEEMEQPPVPVDPAPTEDWVEPVDVPANGRLTERTESVGLSENHMEILAEELKDDIGKEYGVLSFAERFPMVAEMVTRHMKRAQALKLLDDTDPEDIGSLLAEKMREENPITKELIAIAASMGYYG